MTCLALFFHARNEPRYKIIYKKLLPKYNFSAKNRPLHRLRTSMQFKGINTLIKKIALFIRSSFSTQPTLCKPNNSNTPPSDDRLSTLGSACDLRVSVS